MGSASSVGKSSGLTEEQVCIVQEHLEEILSSRAFYGSKRNQEFLRLLVTHALEGDLDGLRERMIGAELFGRPVSYDTGNDSVVRVRASEVRKKLAAYYAESGARQETVRIELSSGSYVPHFHFPEQPENHCAEPPTAQPAGFDPALAQEAARMSASPQEHAEPSSAAEQDHPPRRRRWLFPGGWAMAGMAILIIAILALTVRGWKEQAQKAAAGRGIRSIAILPLENISSDSGQEYFADGITEELINDLGQVPNLRVISLTSSMSYKGTHKTLPTIARELGVDGVLEGGILREGNQVRISVQLIDATADRLVWAHTYMRSLNDVPSWQGEVAQTVAEQISIELTPQQHALLSRELAVDPRAQDLYLHGILLRDADQCEQAIGYFEQAIRLSPGYAQPHSALASCYGRLGEAGRMPYESAFTHQKEEALRAIVTALTS